jgi:hypothetical protein
MLQRSMSQCKATPVHYQNCKAGQLSALAA